MAFQSPSRIPLFALILSSIAVQAASAKTYVVNPDGSGDFPTIQEAVANSVDDDEIQLGDGIFAGDGNRNIIITNQRIAIRSQSDDPTQCIIDCDDQTRGQDFRAFSNSSTDPSGPLIRGLQFETDWPDWAALSSRMDRFVWRIANSWRTRPMSEEHSISSNPIPPRRWAGARS